MNCPMGHGPLTVTATQSNFDLPAGSTTAFGTCPSAADFAAVGGAIGVSTSLTGTCASCPGKTFYWSENLSVTSA